MAFEIGILGIAVSAASTILGALASGTSTGKLLSALFRNLSADTTSTTVEGQKLTALPARAGAPPAPPTRSAHTIKQIEKRLAEARELKRKNEHTAALSKWGGRCLTFGQVVVGGVLASSFMQSVKDKEYVSVFGILVLVSSLLKQAFHPEAAQQEAERNVRHLKALIRRYEDQIAIGRSLEEPKTDDPSQWIALLNKLSDDFDAIEAGGIKPKEQDPGEKPAVKSEQAAAGTGKQNNI